MSQISCCNSVLCFGHLSQLMDEQILCVHGGLSPDIKTLDQIRTIERNQEIPHKGAFCDLVWSDPEDVDTWAISPRGAGWLFGAKVTNEVGRFYFRCAQLTLVVSYLQYTCTKRSNSYVINITYKSYEEPKDTNWINE